MDFVLKMMDVALKMMEFRRDMVDAHGLNMYADLMELMGQSLEFVD